MTKADQERADVLRAELARLCWLALHAAPDTAGLEARLSARLAEARRGQYANAVDGMARGGSPDGR